MTRLTHEIYVSDGGAGCKTKVSELSLDRLESLGEDLLDFQVVGDLEKWLG
jgi:Domain of unknown function (DUF4351)